MEDTRSVRTVPQQGAAQSGEDDRLGQNSLRCKQDRLHTEVGIRPTGPGAWGQDDAGSRGESVTSTQRAAVPNLYKDTLSTRVAPSTRGIVVEAVSPHLPLRSSPDSEFPGRGLWQGWIL